MAISIAQIFHQLDNLADLIHVGDAISMMLGKEPREDAAVIFKGLDGILGSKDQLTVRALALSLSDEDRRYWAGFMGDYILKHDGSIAQKVDAFLIMNAVETFVTKMHNPGTPEKRGEDTHVYERRPDKKKPKTGAGAGKTPEPMFRHTKTRDVMSTPGETKAMALMREVVRILKKNKIFNKDGSPSERKCRKSLGEIKYLIPPIRKVGEGGMMNWVNDNWEWVSAACTRLFGQQKDWVVANWPTLEAEMARRGEAARSRQPSLLRRIMRFGEGRLERNI